MHIATWFHEAVHGFYAIVLIVAWLYFEAVSDLKGKRETINVCVLGVWELSPIVDSKKTHIWILSFKCYYCNATGRRNMYWCWFNDYWSRWCFLNCGWSFFLNCSWSFFLNCSWAFLWTSASSSIITRLPWDKKRKRGIFLEFKTNKHIYHSISAFSSVVLKFACVYIRVRIGMSMVVLDLSWP